MNFEKPNMPGAEELEQASKKRALEAAELVKGGASFKPNEDGTARLVPEDYQIEQMRKEMKEGKVEETRINVGDSLYPLPAKVRVKDEKVVEFLEDVNQDVYVSYGEDNIKEAIKPLEDAGIEVDYKPWTSSEGEDHEGYITIGKEDLNKALAEGRLKLAKKIDEDGEGTLVFE